MDWIEVKNPNPKQDSSTWVEYVAEIRNNETGEIREYETEGPMDNDDIGPAIFNWKDGNYSCDCNRSIMFNTEEAMESECSSGKFSVNLKNKKGGKVYYREFEL